jgi:hypothetical protein
METTYSLPSNTPPSRRFSYETLLRSSFVHPLPFTQIRPALAMTGLRVKQVFDKTMHLGRGRRGDEPFDAEFVLMNGVEAWAKSAMGRRTRVKGSEEVDLFANKARQGCVERRRVDAAAGDSIDDADTSEDDVVVMAWICEKRLSPESRVQTQVGNEK